MIPKSPPGSHPSSEEIYRARRGESDEASRILAHVHLCASCSAEELRQETFDAPASVSPRTLRRAWTEFGKPAAERRPDRPPALALLIAAGAVLAVGLGVFTLRRPGDEPVRGANVGRAAPGPTGDLAEAPRLFPATSSGAAVRVVVFDAERTYDWTSAPTTEGSVPFPEAERRKLRSGVTYTWIVLGTEDTPARSFRIRPPKK